MSSIVLKTLIDCNFKVCRFCLQSNGKELSDIYGEVLDDDANMNIAVHSALKFLDISVTQNDSHPTFICKDCRTLLISIQQFREKVHKSAQTLAQARLLKEFPNVRFAEGTEPEYVEPESVEIKVDYPTYDSDSEAPVQTRNVALSIEQVTIKREPSILCEENDKLVEENLENDNVEISENEYSETEWVVYDDDDPVRDLDAADSGPQRDNAMVEKEDPIFMIKHGAPAPKVCPVCGITSTAMIVHMRTHSKTKPFVCEACKKGFYTRNKLRCHINSAHLNIREFHCEICDKSFVLRKTLKAHMMSHQSEKSHVCSYCPKSFLYRWARVKHERTHTGEKPFQCTLNGCGKSFASSSNLRQHQKTGVHKKKGLEG